MSRFGDGRFFLTPDKGHAAMSDQASANQKIEASTIIGNIGDGDFHNPGNIAGRDQYIYYGEQRPVYEPPPLPPAAELPVPGSLPPYSRMKMGRNALFTGREQELQTLANTLLYPQTAPQSLAITAHGIGGVGKTQLATEFVYRFGRFFAGGVYWVSFADEGAISAEIAACGQMMALHPQYGELPLAQQTELAQREWQDGKARLLIFDNCEEPQLLQQWRPTAGDCRILLTSRRPAWGRTSGTQTLPLATLPRRQSIELLQGLSGLGDEAGNELDAIANTLGDLPLALHLAGSFLGRYGESVTPAGYLAQLADEDLLEHASLIGRGVEDNPTAHTLHVAQTFALSYNQLQADAAIDKVALALLARLAYFAPGEAVPTALLWATLNEEVSELDQVDAQKRLLDLGLAEAGEEAAGLKLHRLLAAFVQGEPGGEAAQADVEATVYAEANRLNGAGYPAALLPWQSHLRHVTEVALVREDERAADLCSALDSHLDALGDYQGALPYSQRALAIFEKVLGPEHPNTALSLNNLGLLLRAMGQLAAARPYYERALAIREKVLGPEHPDTALSLNNLAILAYHEGDMSQAARLLRRALAIWEQRLGADHPQTQSARKSLAVIEAALG